MKDKNKMSTNQQASHDVKKLPDFFESEFQSLLEKDLEKKPREGTIVKGKIVQIIEESVFVDVNLKTEGKIQKNEFGGDDIKIGDEVDVYIERLEGRNGCTHLSREKVEKEKAWDKFEKLNIDNDNITGKIIGKVNKGGFAVEIDGMLAFLPGSQLDIRPVKDPSVFMNLEQQFKILKVDKEQGNVVVSRRAVLEESRQEAKDELLSGIKEGMTFEGVIKNITNYGAFVDLGDIDGLLHITDISWERISHPSEKLTLGQDIKVMVTKFNPDTKRVSLGLKQLSDNPWHGLEKKYVARTKHKGRVRGFSEHGVFVELEKGVDGLVYLNEIAWSTKNTHPTKLVSLDQEVEVMVLDFDMEKHRISLSIKACTENPWKKFIEKHPISTIVKARVKKVVDFGLYVNVIEGDGINDLEILVPAIEISNDLNPKLALKEYSVDDEIKGMVLTSDLERERVTLSIKKIQESNNISIMKKIIDSGPITCTVLEVTKDGLFVEMPEGMKGFIKRYDLSKHRDQQKSERFTVGDRIDAKAVSYDKNKNIAVMSVKLLEIEEEKKAIKEYGSVDSGASLGDILGAAIESQQSKKSSEKKIDEKDSVDE
jgi:small subunit ribosomal protein S1